MKWRFNWKCGHEQNIVLFLFDFTYERKEGQVGVAIENKQDIKELKLIVLFLFGFCIFYLTGEKSLHYLKPTKIKELEPIALFSFNLLKKQIDFLLIYS